MNTLDELIRYCNEERHLGALLLTGEWGCGKTYLVDRDLADALHATHFIVRVSFLGIDSVEALNDVVRKQYLMVCTPYLGKMKQRKENMKNGQYFLGALAKALEAINPIQGGIASAFVGVDPLEYIPLEPVVEDFHEKKAKKRVVLVFDDLNRSQLDWGKFVGTINEYCENKGFTTIVIGDMEAIRANPKFDTMLYKTVKEKTIARTVRYLPDFQKVVAKILEESEWPSPDYAEFLAENVQTITDVFCDDASVANPTIRKYHNLRSLNCALQDFYRLYEILTEHQVPEISRYLYSFIVYILISRNGLNNGGQPYFDYSEEEIEQLYTGYSPDYLPESVIQWVEDGILDEDRISADIGQRIQKDELSAVCTEGAEK